MPARRALLASPRASPAPRRAPAGPPPRRPPPRRAGCACGGGCPACRAPQEADASPPPITPAPDARPRLQRKPADPPATGDAPTEIPPSVTTGATAGTVAPRGTEVAGGVVDAATPFYAGDLILVRVSRLGAEFPPGSLTLTLPPGDLELADAAGGDTAWLRVTASPDSIAAGRILEVVLATPAVPDPITLRLRLAPTPEKPRIAPTEEEIRGELIAIRQEMASVRAEMRQLPAEERESREPVLLALRNERAALADAGEATARLSCGSQARPEIIQQALDLASDRVGRAIARLQAGADSDAEVTAALVQYLRIDPAPEASGARQAAAQKCIDVLSTTRNAMLTATLAQFDCVSDSTGDCQSNKGKAASVSRPTARGGKITICERLFGQLPARGGEADPVTPRAFALFHEFVHTSGITAAETALPTGKDEMYAFDPRWPELTPAQAATLADAYATLAFALTPPAGG